MISEEELVRLLKYDFSKGHEEFKERLLARCLAIVDGEGDDADGASDANETDAGTDDRSATEPATPAFSLVEPEGMHETHDADVTKLSDMDLIVVAGGIRGMSPTQKGNPDDRIVP